MPSWPDADACVGLVVCASASHGTLPRMLLAWRPHGSQRGCGGASPAQSCLQGQASVRTRSAGGSGRRLALRRRGRNAARDHRGPVRRQRKTWVPETAGTRDQQSTGQSGHGTNGYLHRWAGSHRRTPHGRAFACSARTRRHLVANPIASSPVRAATRCPPGSLQPDRPSASQDDGKSLRFRRATARHDPRNSGRCTSRAADMKTRPGGDQRP